ncbi:hypothetical protein BS50DRAFT_675702 [Corynespora cassiicola Philippines]|uniref:Uncharacterized protein n=1 Tax=Corynespora cassiicola Philippines TaxID=1448308 RepID=A0A2T2NQI0_CORCC|nr:hypothetical protein BS50DRAFT_675702 [Corynespora cassiicola Philippines]
MLQLFILLQLMSIMPDIVVADMTSKCPHQRSFLWSLVTSPICIVLIFGYTMLLISPKGQNIALSALQSLILVLDNLRWSLKTAYRFVCRMDGLPTDEVEVLQVAHKEHINTLIHKREFSEASRQREAFLKEQELEKNSTLQADLEAANTKIAALEANATLGSHHKTKKKLVDTQQELAWAKDDLKHRNNDNYRLTAELEHTQGEKNHVVQEATEVYRRLVESQVENQKLKDRLVAMEGQLEEKDADHQAAIGAKDQQLAVFEKLLDAIHNLAEGTGHVLLIIVMWAKLLQEYGFNLVDLKIDQRRLELLLQYVLGGQRSDLAVQPQSSERGFRFTGRYLPLSGIQVQGTTTFDTRSVTPVQLPAGGLQSLLAASVPPPPTPSLPSPLVRSLPPTLAPNQERKISPLAVAPPLTVGPSLPHLPPQEPKVHDPVAMEVNAPAPTPTSFQSAQAENPFMNAARLQTPAPAVTQSLQEINPFMNAARLQAPAPAVTSTFQSSAFRPAQQQGAFGSSIASAPSLSPFSNLQQREGFGSSTAPAPSPFGNMPFQQRAQPATFGINNAPATSKASLSPFGSSATATAAQSSQAANPFLNAARLQTPASTAQSSQDANPFLNAARLQNPVSSAPASNFQGLGFQGGRPGTFGASSNPAAAPVQPSATSQRPFGFGTSAAGPASGGFSGCLSMACGTSSFSRLMNDATGSSSGTGGSGTGFGATSGASGFGGSTSAFGQPVGMSGAGSRSSSGLDNQVVNNTGFADSDLMGLFGGKRRGAR